MPYYRGDYYRGDYYQGDFFGSIFGGIKGAVKGFASGGLLGAIKGGVKGLVSSGAHPNLPQPKSMAIAPNFYPGTGPPDVGGQIAAAQINAGYVPDVNVPPAAMIPAFANTGPAGPLKGYHANKTTYETRGGGTSRWPHSLVLHPKGSVLVKNRRMNVGNARALKRALRRAGGFARLARRVMSFTHPRAGRGHFKFKRRAKR